MSGLEHPGGQQGYGGVLISFLWSYPLGLLILTILISCLPTFLLARAARVVLHPLPLPQNLHQQAPLQPRLAQGPLLLQRHRRSAEVLVGLEQRRVPALIPVRRRMRTIHSVFKQKHRQYKDIHLISRSLLGQAIYPYQSK